MPQTVSLALAPAPGQLASTPGYKAGKRANPESAVAPDEQGIDILVGELLTRRCVATGDCGQHRSETSRIRRRTRDSHPASEPWRRCRLGRTHRGPSMRYARTG